MMVVLQTLIARGFTISLFSSKSTFSMTMSGLSLPIWQSCRQRHNASQCADQHAAFVHASFSQTLDV